MRGATARVAALIIGLLAACAAPPDPADPAAPTAVPPAPGDPGTWTSAADADAALLPLDAPRLLRRLSIDLRGALPSVEELDRVEADPDALAALRDAFLDDPRFEERLVDLLGERFHTTVDEFLITYREFPGLGSDRTLEYAWERAVGEEPVRLMARIAVDDRPWTDIVAADTTMANELLGVTWPVDYPDGAVGWQEVSYTDGRPAVGILATNGLWWRYYTTFSNYNRGRAAALTNLLLCVDYLARPVSFVDDTQLSDEGGPEAALRANPYCMGCHAAVDPIAASLFGFWTPQEYSAVETTTYHPERERLGAELLGVAPSWYGAPVSSLAELGSRIAADPRFDRCAAESAAEMLWRRDATAADFDRVEALRQAYLAGGGRLKPLLAAVTDTAVYRAGALGPTATGAQAEDEATVRFMHVGLLASVLGDLSAFTWRWEGYDQLDNDTLGFRVLGGGADGAYVTRAADTPGLTWVAVHRAVAEAAATDLVAHDLASHDPGGGDTPWLLSGVTDADRPGDAAFDAAIEGARWRLFARRLTDAERAEDAALWEAVAAADTPLGAWSALVAAWLRDPDFVGY